MLAQLSNPWWVFIVLGISAGILSGALGLGSGIIIVPALVIICGFGQKNAQGMSLAIMIPMAIVGVCRYWMNPQIEMNPLVITLIVCGAVVGALIGAELASRLPAHILRKAFAVFLVIAATRMFISSKPKNTDVGQITNQKNVTLIEPGGTNNGSE